MRRSAACQERIAYGLDTVHKGMHFDWTLFGVDNVWRKSLGNTFLAELCLEGKLLLPNEEEEIQR